MITPTIGRVLWYHDGGAQPQVALVAYVWGDRCVNIALFDPNGNIVKDPPTSVQLLQDDDEAPASGYCTWMPFQKAAASQKPVCTVRVAANAEELAAMDKD